MPFFPATPWIHPDEYRPDPPQCPTHGVAMRHDPHWRTDDRDEYRRELYRCPSVGCSVSCKVYADGSLASTPADRETALARSKAHRELDRLWKPKRGRHATNCGMPRRDAYKLVQSLLGLPEHEAHIGLLSREQCEQLTDMLALRRRRLEDHRRLMKRRGGGRY